MEQYSRLLRKSRKFDSHIHCVLTSNPGSYQSDQLMSRKIENELARSWVDITHSTVRASAKGLFDLFYVCYNVRASRTTNTGDSPR